MSKMDLSTEYRLMCLKADDIQEAWNPMVGDYMLSKASYCCKEDGSCSRDNPCRECLRMCNVWVISGQYDYHDSVGGTHWFFGGHACARGGGNEANSTACSIMTSDGCSEIGDEFNTSSKNEFIWLPRQDQLQAMINNFDTSIEKLEKFNEWLFYNKDDYFQDDSMEKLWMKYFMYELSHNHKVWFGSDEIGWDIDDDL